MAKHEEVKNYVRLRINDDSILTQIDELLNTKLFRSVNEVLNRAIEFGMPLIYKEIFGKKILDNGSLSLFRSFENEEIIIKKLNEVNLTTDDIFVVLNLIEYLTTTIFNIELAKLNGKNVTDDEVRSGLYSELPEQLQVIKDELNKKHIDRRKK